MANIEEITKILPIIENLLGVRLKIVEFDKEENTRAEGHNDKAEYNNLLDDFTSFVANLNEYTCSEFFGSPEACDILVKRIQNQKSTEGLKKTINKIYSNYNKYVDIKVAELQNSKIPINE